MNDRLHQLLDSMAARGTGLHGCDFLLTWDKSLDDLRTILDAAEALRLLRLANVSTRCFDSGLAVSLFRDNSTRTRFSYASAANLLGLAVQDLDEGKSQISHGETTRETAVMISFLSDVIGIRDDMYLGAGHTYMLEVAAALDEAHGEGVLPVRPPVVNLQCDQDHPTQSLADLAHLVSEFGSLENLRGKKLVMSWAYSPSYGKPLSVPQGIVNLMPRLGMDVVLAHPEGYDLVPGTLERAGQQATPERRQLPRGHQPGRRLRRRRHRLPQELGPLRRDGAPHRAAARRRPGGPRRRSSASAWPTTPSTATGPATARSWTAPGTARPSTCTACPPTSPASPASGARSPPTCSTSTASPSTARPATSPTSSPP